jgi:hypothetical protein
MWASPLLGTLVALYSTGIFPLGVAFGAEALAMYSVTAFYCAVYHERKPIETLQYVTLTYFLPGAVIAFLLGSFAKWTLNYAKRLRKR